MSPTPRTLNGRVRAHSVRTLATLVLAAVGVVPLATVAAAQTVPSAGATQTVTYRGYQVQVPASWSVMNLEADPRACVRLDQHAVYLGHPGQAQNCPQQIIGHVEALVIEPADALAAADRHPAEQAKAGGSPAPNATESADRLMRVDVTDAGLVVTESWNTDRPSVDAALRSGRLTGAAGTPTSSSPSTSSTTAPNSTAAPAPASGGAALANPLLRAFNQAPTASAVAPSVTALQRMSGEGFDACSLPSDPSLMSSVKTQTGWVAAGFYLGGANVGCPQLSFGASYVKAVTAQGWTLIPIWVGKQINTCGGGCSTIDPNQAVQQGSAEADGAVAAAQQVGIGPTSPLYLDLEGYPVSAGNANTALLFTQGWTGRLHALGYTSGFYSSAGSGITDIANAAQNGFGNMPDDIWIARYDCNATTADSAVPSNLWVNHRLRQYRSPSTSCSTPQASVPFQYDSDHIGGDTAGAGNGGFPAYVLKIYSDFLGRVPDGPGNAYWVGQLRAGLPWASFVYAITTSGEHIRRSADGDFLRFLHRVPDAAGSDYWTWILAGSLRNDFVEATMTASGEYYATQGNNDPTTWLQHLYVDTLGRAADQPGLNYWLGRLQSGTSRFAITSTFVDSTDGAAFDVDYAFGVTLHRAADAGGRAYYASVLQQQLGMNIFQLDALLDSSWEAWSQAQG